MTYSNEIKVPITIIKKVDRLLKAISQRNRLEDEVVKWIEKQGINVQDIDFIDSVMDKLSYGEMDNGNDLEKYLNEYLNRFK